MISGNHGKISQKEVVNALTEDVSKAFEGLFK